MENTGDIDQDTRAIWTGMRVVYCGRIYLVTDVTGRALTLTGGLTVPACHVTRFHY
jgi:hypothetical protein